MRNKRAPPTTAAPSPHTSGCPSAGAGTPSSCEHRCPALPAPSLGISVLPIRPPSQGICVLPSRHHSWASPPCPSSHHPWASPSCPCATIPRHLRPSHPAPSLGTSILPIWHHSQASPPCPRATIPGHLHPTTAQRWAKEGSHQPPSTVCPPQQPPLLRPSPWGRGCGRGRARDRAGRRSDAGGGRERGARKSRAVPPAGSPGPPGHHGLNQGRSQAWAVPVGPGPAPSYLSAAPRRVTFSTEPCLCLKGGREEGRRGGSAG